MIRIKSKIIIIVYLYVAHFSSIIHGNDLLTEHLTAVEAIAECGGLINDIFKPLKGGFKGNGSIGFAYQGKLLPIKKEIVMKFTTLARKQAADDEYEMYTYLKAINNKSVEAYGIPSVYYFGEWNQLMMMGFTLLDQDLYELVDSKQLFEHDVNVLIVLRDFILISKYIHANGIRHDDIKLANMMVRRHRTFLIDFNLSTRMTFKGHAGTFIYLSRRAHIDGTLYPKDDWESFLYSMCHSLGVNFDWIEKDPVEKVALKDRLKQITRILKRKENTQKTIKQIETIGSETLRKILVQLAEHIFDDGGKCANKSTVFNGDDKKKFPDYDRFYELVNDEIKTFDLPKPVIFSWLTKEKKASDIIALEMRSTPDITKIDDPSKQDYITKNYPMIEREYFTDAYKDWYASRLPIDELSVSSENAERKESKSYT